MNVGEAGGSRSVAKEQASAEQTEAALPEAIPANRALQDFEAKAAASSSSSGARVPTGGPRLPERKARSASGERLLAMPCCELHGRQAAPRNSCRRVQPSQVPKLRLKDRRRVLRLALSPEQTALVSCLLHPCKVNKGHGEAHQRVKLKCILFTQDLKRVLEDW